MSLPTYPHFVSFKHLPLGEALKACYELTFAIYTRNKKQRVNIQLFGWDYHREGECFMGKGDRRTKRGKIWRGSTGNSRLRKQKKAKSKK